MTTLSSSTAPAGRRRFWIAVLCFLVLNAAAWVAYDRYFAWRHRGTLRVDSFSPGNGMVVGQHPTMLWHFSSDVVPSGAYGKAPGTIVPAVAGRWNWEDPRTLTFIPDAPLPRATPVVFTLADTFLLTPTGGQLSQPYITTVKCAPLSLESVYQVAVLNRDQYVLALRFNDDVKTDDVLTRLKLTDRAGDKITFTEYGDHEGKIVRVKTAPVQHAVNDDNAWLNVHLDAGLVGASGPLGIDVPVEQTVLLSQALAATGLKAGAPARGQAHLILTFNNSIDPLELRKVLSIDPPVAYTPESRGNATVLLNGNFIAGTRYTVKLSEPPAGSDKSKFPRPDVLATFIPDRRSDVWFDSDQGYLSAAGNRTLVAHAVNVAKMELTITRMYDNNVVVWRNSGNRFGGTEAYSRPIVRKTIDLANKKNQQEDVTLSLDSLLGRQAAQDGVYRVSLRAVTQASRDDDDDWYPSSSNSTVVTLSDIGLTAKATRDGLAAWATSLRTARPMAGVRIRYFSSKNQLLGQAITNADGLAMLHDIHLAKEETGAIVLADIQPAAPSLPFGPPLPVTTAGTNTANDAPSNETARRQLTWLDLHDTAWELGDSDTGGRAYLRKGYEAILYTDRGVYRPGEMVHLRAIVRGPDGETPGTTFPVRWQLLRPDMHDWKGQVVMLDSDGAASLDMTMPADLPTGQWTARLGLPSSDGHSIYGTVTFQIEEFLPNRLKVEMNLATGGPSATTQPAETSPARYSIDPKTPLVAQVQADYLFGRPADGLTMEWSTRAEPSTFQPAGMDDWEFNDSAKVRTAAIGNSAGSQQSAPSPRSNRPNDRGTVEMQLDAKGHCVVPIDAAELVGLSDAPGGYMGPWQLSTAAGVREAGGRAVTVGRQIAIDALPAYIGLRAAENGTAHPGQAFPIRIMRVAPDGHPTTGGKLTATLYRQIWNTVLVYRDGQYHYTSTRILEPLDTSDINLADSRGEWSPAIPTNGEFVASISDPATGALASIEFYATNGSSWDENINRDKPERLTVRILSPSEPTDPSAALADPADAAPTGPRAVGETVNVLVASPFAGRLLLTVETDEVVQSTVINMAASHVIVPVKITEAMRPNAFISATVLRPIDPQAKWQTHRAFGVARLRVDPADRRLNIAIDAPIEIEPLHSLDVGLIVTDAQGQRVANAPITVAAVDEGICSLTNFKTPDPLAFFNANRALAVRTSDLYSLLMPEVARTSDVGGDGSNYAPARHITPVVARRVKPVALAWRQVRTDAQGRARTSFQLPEFQGRLRVMAVAYKASSFGSADKGVTVRSPILAQTTWPRFAAPGDHFSVPVVLFNNSGSAGEATVKVDLLNEAISPKSSSSPSGSGRAGANGENDISQATTQSSSDAVRPHPNFLPEGEGAGGALMSFGAAAEQPHLSLPPVTLANGGQRKIELPVSIGQAVGVARIQLTVTMNGQQYVEHLELPVRPAAPMMQYGGYAVASTTQPATFLPAVPLLEGTQSLSIQLSPWPTFRLPQGLAYLDRYPYGCVEQTTSTCFPLLTLGDIGRTIDPVQFSPQRIKIKIDAGIMHLIGMQTNDGGLAMWPGGRESWPWASIYAAHFLTEARADGYDVPDDFYKPLMAYVHSQSLTNADTSQKLEQQAYCQYVLALADLADRPALSRLTELADAAALPDSTVDDRAMCSDARLMLALAWQLAGRHDLATALIPELIPPVRATRQSADNLGSPARDRAMMIEALLDVQPDHPALAHLVQELADDAAHNRWASTQDTAFSVMAIGKYLRTIKKHEPYDSAKILLGKTLLAQSAGGQSLSWSTASVSASATTQPADGGYSVQITGSRTAVGHVAWLRSGVPLTPPPDAEHGLKIARRYLDLDGHPIGPQVRSGDLVQVELTLEAPATQHNLVIEDLLPAGLEVENPRLATSAAQSPQNRADQPPQVGGVPVFNDDYLDVRDDRVVIVGHMNGSSKARCIYLARAVTPGVYVVPPVRIEAMYDINLNALSGAGKTLTVTSATNGLAKVEE